MSIINFMLYYNGIMFFHKSMDATEKNQDLSYLRKEIASVVDEVFAHNVTQIVTDNGADDMKACRLIARKHRNIIWQPCVSHTINLMLKQIREFPDDASIIESGRKIFRWIYNHSKLHTMIKKHIRGELVE